MILWTIVKQQRRLGNPWGNDLREGLLTYPLLSIVNDDNKDKLLADIKDLNNGGDEQAIIDYVIAQGGIDRKSTRLNSSHSRASRMPSSA